MEQDNHNKQFRQGHNWAITRDEADGTLFLGWRYCLRALLNGAMKRGNPDFTQVMDVEYFTPEELECSNRQ